ncbi:MAG: S1 RNA-binding domain-containing protein, partial [Gammaproteobacteria bacterium]|nr:S1 RNA-binding domain-containing protein [Gammaproteobacteria bacterium]
MTQVLAEISFAEMFEQSLAGGQSMQPGTIVSALVLEVKADVVIVDAGLKSEGVIPIAEFMVDGAPATVMVGDRIEVALETVEDGFGETRFSKEKAERIRTWDRLTKAFEGKETVIGIIT